MIIKAYQDNLHRSSVISLWEKVFDANAPHRKPSVSIDNKIAQNDGMFLVAELDDKIVGTIMYGYDGHRGWIYALAVDPKHRNRKIASKLLETTERTLKKLGCLKINLQVLNTNTEVIEFYKKNGFTMDPVVSMGKKLY
jgi:ribosomal protein S18 acetylase RimI-like enzyme